MANPPTSRVAATLATIDSWPVPSAAAGVVLPDLDVVTHGPAGDPFRLASISKLITAYGVLVAVEEGTVGLDDDAGPPGCTVRHLLAHAGGYAFDGDQPIAAPGERRIYSNTGYEVLADHLQRASGLTWNAYVREAVTEPLGMTATVIEGSPAKDFRGSLDDVVRFAAEMMRPTLISSDTWSRATSPVFPALVGVVPGFGRFDPCGWGLGPEIRGDKAPHWTSRHNSPATFGHFGGSGTFVWVDPQASCALACLTDRAFGEWTHGVWPALGDDILGLVNNSSAGGTS